MEINWQLLFKNIMQPVHMVLGFISNFKMYGIFPLDILCHLMVGMLVSKKLIKDKKKPWKAFFVVLVLAILKECFDYFRINFTIMESIKDIIVTMTYPTYYLLRGLVMKYQDRR